MFDVWISIFECDIEMASTLAKKDAAPPIDVARDAANVRPNAKATLDTDSSTISTIGQSEIDYCLWQGS